MPGSACPVRGARCITTKRAKADDPRSFPPFPHKTSQRPPCSSAKCIGRAHQKHGSERSRFLLIDDYPPTAQVDLAYCNGVFHHVPVSKRDQVIADIACALRPGGLFALWENNPLNPGTRYVMSRIPFDRDAITLSSAETRRRLETGGFQILRTHFLFIFPKALSWLRWMEPFVSGLPLGAQYLVLGRKHP